MKLHCSSSVKNFEEKIFKNWKVEKYHWWNIFQPVVFFGMYHWIDYLRFILHRDKKYVFWCGSDILQLKASWIFKKFKAKHFCENIEEWEILYQKGIEAKTECSFVDNINDFPLSFKPSKTPHVFLSMRPGREKEYGLDIVKQLAVYFPTYTFHIYGIKKKNEKNIIYHGHVSNEQFNREIRNYHCGLRFNKFEGFSEIIAKSVLMGQYPISRIYYPYVGYFRNGQELREELEALKDYKESNRWGRDYWLKNINNFPFLWKFFPTNN